MEDSFNYSNHLKGLGSSTQYEYFEPKKEVLEHFPNTDGELEILLHHKEFTSICPKTGQPDFGEVWIRYNPIGRCVESKSLKLYLMAFRQYGGFCEKVCQKIADDLFSILLPYILEVKVLFTYRGGISIESSTRRFSDDD